MSINFYLKYFFQYFIYIIFLNKNQHDIIKIGLFDE